MPFEQIINANFHPDHIFAIIGIKFSETKAVRR